MQEGQLPQEIRALRKSMRPLFCRSPEEFAAFDAYFDAWVIDTRDPKDLLTDLGRLVAARLRQQGHQVFVYTYQEAPNGFVDATG